MTEQQKELDANFQLEMALLGRFIESMATAPYYQKDYTVQALYSNFKESREAFIALYNDWHRLAEGSK